MKAYEISECGWSSDVGSSDLNFGLEFSTISGGHGQVQAWTGWGKGEEVGCEISSQAGPVLDWYL